MKAVSRNTVTIRYRCDTKIGLLYHIIPCINKLKWIKNVQIRPKIGIIKYIYPFTFCKESTIKYFKGRI